MTIFLTVIILLGNNHKYQTLFSYYQCVFMTDESVGTIRQAIKRCLHPFTTHHDVTTTRAWRLFIRVTCNCVTFVLFACAAVMTRRCYFQPRIFRFQINVRCAYKTLNIVCLTSGLRYLLCLNIKLKLKSKIQ